jgi:hypothetical protein
MLRVLKELFKKHFQRSQQLMLKLDILMENYSKMMKGCQSYRIEMMDLSITPWYKAQMPDLDSTA